MVTETRDINAMLDKLNSLGGFTVTGIEPDFTGMGRESSTYTIKDENGREGTINTSLMLQSNPPQYQIFWKDEVTVTQDDNGRTHIQHNDKHGDRTIDAGLFDSMVSGWKRENGIDNGRDVPHDRFSGGNRLLPGDDGMVVPSDRFADGIKPWIAPIREPIPDDILRKIIKGEHKETPAFSPAIGDKTKADYDMALGPLERQIADGKLNSAEMSNITGKTFDDIGKYHREMAKAAREAGFKDLAKEHSAIAEQAYSLSADLKDGKLVDGELTKRVGELVNDIKDLDNKPALTIQKDIGLADLTPQQIRDILGTIDKKDQYLESNLKVTLLGNDQMLENKQQAVLETAQLPITKEGVRGFIKDNISEDALAVFDKLDKTPGLAKGLKDFAGAAEMAMGLVSKATQTDHGTKAATSLAQAVQSKGTLAV